MWVFVLVYFIYFIVCGDLKQGKRMSNRDELLRKHCLSPEEI